MQYIQLPDQLYIEVRRRASEAGFSSVDEYIQDVLDEGSIDDTPNLDHLFTPKIVEHLKRIENEIAAGAKTYTEEEVDLHLAEERAAWQRKQSS